MADLVFSVAAANFDDTPNESGFTTQVNTLFASLLSNTIRGIAFVADDAPRGLGNELKLTVSYDQAGTAIGTPYLVQHFIGKSLAEVNSDVLAFFAANPTYFVSQVYLQALRSARRTAQVVAIVFYNTVAANGVLNWAAGGSTGGGGGGTSLTGTLAVGANTVDSLAIATYGDALWEILIRKGTTRFSTNIRANHNGTTPNHVEYGSVVSPPAGTVDVTFDVDISGANMRLVATAGSTGWTYSVLRRTLNA